ncbi:hypothetical protein BaRGS_00024824 [Batillaria attramentaria]|uniref:Uncharacterized protein n=1 Tax=Batillaria attramentaria TaxID=370345 RepID=A0ABD0K9Y9_9CAEN
MPQVPVSAAFHTARRIWQRSRDRRQGREKNIRQHPNFPLFQEQTLAGTKQSKTNSNVGSQTEDPILISSPGLASQSNVDSDSELPHGKLDKLKTA